MFNCLRNLLGLNKKSYSWKSKMQNGVPLNVACPSLHGDNGIVISAVNGNAAFFSDNEINIIKSYIISSKTCT